MTFEQRFTTVCEALDKLARAVRIWAKNISRHFRLFLQIGRRPLKYITFADVVRANTRPIQRLSIKETQMRVRPVTRRARSSC